MARCPDGPDAVDECLRSRDAVRGRGPTRDDDREPGRRRRRRLRGQPRGRHASRGHGSGAARRPGRSRKGPGAVPPAGSRRRPGGNTAGRAPRPIPHRRVGHVGRRLCVRAVRCPDPREAAHLRRAALRYGLDVDAAYRLIIVSAGDDDDEQGRADRIGGLIGISPSAIRARAGISLPEVLVWHRWIVVLAPADWPAAARLRPALEHVLGSEWTALVGPSEPGVGSLAPTLARLTATLRAAERLGHRGWIRSEEHTPEL